MSRPHRQSSLLSVLKAQAASLRRTAVRTLLLSFLLARGKVLREDGAGLLEIVGEHRPEAGGLLG